MDNATTRHGQRAEGIVTVSFPCSKALKRELSAIASKDSRTLSAWLRLKLQETVRRNRAGRKGRTP